MKQLPTAAEVRAMAVGLLNDSRSAARKKASRMLLQFADLLEAEQSQSQKISFLISVVKSGEQITETEEEMLRNPAARLLPLPLEAE